MWRGSRVMLLPSTITPTPLSSVMSCGMWGLYWAPSQHVQPRMEYSPVLRMGANSVFKTSTPVSPTRRGSPQLPPSHTSIT